MTVWTLKTLDKKSAETHTFLTKGSRRIKIVEGFRWGTVYLTTDGDTPPVIDLTNPDGLDTYTVPDTEWDLESFDDGCYSSIELIKGKMSDDKLEELEELYGEDGIEGLEDDGWEDEGECEWWFYGPLQLEDEHGNIVGEQNAQKST